MGLYSFKSSHGNKFGKSCISYLAEKSVTSTKFKRNIWVQGELNTWGEEKKEWTTCADAQEFPCITSKHKSPGFLTHLFCNCILSYFDSSDYCNCSCFAERIAGGGRWDGPEGAGMSEDSMGSAPVTLVTVPPGPGAGVAQRGQSRAAPQGELQKCPCQPCVDTQHLYPETMVSPRLSKEQGFSK